LIPALQHDSLPDAGIRLTSKNYGVSSPTSCDRPQDHELAAIAGSVGPEALDISTLLKDQGVFTFDPGFMATAATASAITYIDGDAGVLLYRGYPIEQLAKHSTFLEVSYLLQKGELPGRDELEEFTRSIRRHTMLNEWILRLYRGFHHDAHPMAMVATIVASLAAFYHDSTDINDDRHREIFSHRIIAKLPTIAAAAYKHALGQPFIYPRNDLDYTANMLHMFFAVPCEAYEVDPLYAQALDLLFILHADHEQNASTSTVRIAGSTGCNPYTAMSAGVSALWGPGARRRQRGRGRHAAEDRRREPRPGVPDPRERQQGRRAAHGLRPPCLQELRPARDADPRNGAQGARQARPERQPAFRARIEAGGSRAQGRLLRQPQALPERRLLFRASSTARSASRARCSR
jgi:hypothetical protein